MSKKMDITVTIIFHHEGPLVIPALASMHDMVEQARASMLKIEARAILDQPDNITKNLVKTHGKWLCDIREASEGDLGLARNIGVRAAQGNFLAFLDGDDLWGENWLHSAYNAAINPNSPREAIWHPEALYYFSEGDFGRHSVTELPNSEAKSFFMSHDSSTASGFDRDVLFFNNIWTANVFAHRDVYEKFPYAAVDREAGFGIEDWSWHMQTLWADVPHLVVPETIHLIRIKEAGSLGMQNTTEGLLPHIPEGAQPRLGKEREKALPK